MAKMKMKSGTVFLERSVHRNEIDILSKTKVLAISLLGNFLVITESHFSSDGFVKKHE